MQKTHLAYLGKKGDELSECPERGFIKRAQKGVNHDGRFVWQLDDIKKVYAMISGVRVKWLRRE